MRTRLACLLLLLLAPLAHAGTWDEPWHDEVLRQADTLGLYEVVQVDAKKLTLRRIRTLAGEQTPDQLVVDGLYRLPHHEDTAGHGLDESMAFVEAGEQSYLLLKRVDGHWQLPTPSSGFATLIAEGRVAATYRASFHQAVQDADDYERVQACLFRALHDGECDVATLAAELDAPLAETPGGLNGTEADAERFFRQHVALESAALLKRSLPLSTLEPFLQDAGYHTQLSAVRALVVNAEPGRNARLLAFIQDPERDVSARAMGVQLAAGLGDAALIAALKAYGPEAPEDEAALAMDIMDPRIGTRFPASVKAAIEAL